jgi:uncharacterized membrane protein (DUF485 family)
MKLGAVAHMRMLTCDDDPAWVVEQRGSHGAAVAQILLVMPVALVCLAPFAWVAAETAVRPGTLSMLVDRPASAGLIVIGMVMAALLVVMPVRAVIERLGRRQTVEISEGAVTVRDEGLFGTRVWSAPIAAFAGVAHHIRASLSGARHEIVLVHPVRHRSVLLHFDTVVREGEVQEMARRLGIPVISARSIYRAEPAPVELALAAA